DPTVRGRGRSPPARADGATERAALAADVRPERVARALTNVRTLRARIDVHDVALPHLEVRRAHARAADRGDRVRVGYVALPDAIDAERRNAAAVGVLVPQEDPFDCHDGGVSRRARILDHARARARRVRRRGEDDEG